MSTDSASTGKPISVPVLNLQGAEVGRIDVNPDEFGGTISMK